MMVPGRISMKGVIAGVAGLAVGVAAYGQDAKKPPEKPIDLSKPTLFVVGYAHLDTQWRWAYPQTIREFIPLELLELRREVLLHHLVPARARKIEHVPRVLLEQGKVVMQRVRDRSEEHT